MMKVLVVTSRNIITTCGELRLIKGRAAALKKEYGIKTDFIAYRIKPPSTDRYESLNRPLKVYRCPVDHERLKNAVRSLCESGKYSCVILSGPFVYYLIDTIRKAKGNIKIILDYHGSMEEIREFKQSSIVKRAALDGLYYYTKRAEKKQSDKADGFFAVSNALAEEILGKNPDFKSFIVPCAAEESISFEEYKEFRKKYRKKYGIADDDKVFVYSGGNSLWQCVSESVQLYRRIHKIFPNTKLLLFSGSRELLEKYKGEPDIITDSLAPEIVTAALCAGDYGMMLRGDFVTNHVAFPNKFLEYVISGLRVIATPYVYDVRDYIKRFNIGFIVDLYDEGKEIIESIDKNYDMTEHFERRDELLEVCGFRNTLKSFVEYIGEA